MQFKQNPTKIVVQAKDTKIQSSHITFHKNNRQTFDRTPIASGSKRPASTSSADISGKESQKNKEQEYAKIDFSNSIEHIICEETKAKIDALLFDYKSLTQMSDMEQISTAQYLINSHQGNYLFKNLQSFRIKLLPHIADILVSANYINLLGENISKLDGIKASHIHVLEKYGYLNEVACNIQRFTLFNSDFAVKVLDSGYYEHFLNNMEYFIENMEAGHKRDFNLIAHKLIELEQESLLKKYLSKFEELINPEIDEKLDVSIAFQLISKGFSQYVAEHLKAFKEKKPELIRELIVNHQAISVLSHHSTENDPSTVRQILNILIDTKQFLAILDNKHIFIKKENNEEKSLINELALAQNMITSDKYELICQNANTFSKENHFEICKMLLDKKSIYMLKDTVFEFDLSICELIEIKKLIIQNNVDEELMGDMENRIRLKIRPLEESISNSIEQKDPVVCSKDSEYFHILESHPQYLNQKLKDRILLLTKS